MKKYKKLVIVLFIVIVFIAIALFGGFLGAGNYGYTQKYEFDINADSLIKSIKNLKTKNPTLKVPSYVGLVDSLDTGNNYFHFYVFLSDKNEIVHFLISTNQTDSDRGTIYLDAVNEGLVTGHWKEINRDYDRNDNLEIKKQFTNAILDKLKLNYKDKGNGMFIFWK